MVCGFHRQCVLQSTKCGVRKAQKGRKVCLRKEIRNQRVRSRQQRKNMELLSILAIRRLINLVKSIHHGSVSIPLIESSIINSPQNLNPLPSPFSPPHHPLRLRYPAKLSKLIPIHSGSLFTQWVPVSISHWWGSFQKGTSLLSIVMKSGEKSLKVGEKNKMR